MPRAEGGIGRNWGGDVVSSIVAIGSFGEIDQIGVFASINRVGEKILSSGLNVKTRERKLKGR